MSYLDFNDKIGIKEPLTYNDFNESISYHTVNLLRSTNNYAKKTAINLLESSDNTDDTIEYEKTLKDTSTSITDLYERLVDSEYNRLYEKTVNMKNIVDSIKKKILMGKLPECNEYPLYEKFFKPDLDRLSDALSKPFINLADEMLGQKIIFSSNELNGSQQKIIDLIQAVQTQVGKDRNTMKSLLPKVSDNENFDSIIDIKNTIKSNINGYKKINLVYDKYLYDIQFILNQFANHCGDAEDKNNSNDKMIVPDNEERNIVLDKIYDISGANECILDFNEKIEYINTQLENISIKLELESLNEETSPKPNKFMQFIEWLINAVKAIGQWIAKTWKELIIKAKYHFDFYGKWISSHEEAIRKIATEKSQGSQSIATLNVCDWKMSGTNIISAKGVADRIYMVIGKRGPGDDVSRLESALKEFDNKYKSREDIYNVLGQSLSKNLKLSGGSNKKEKLASIISLYRSDPKTKQITLKDCDTYISVLKNSSKNLQELINSSQMNALQEKSYELTRSLDLVKTKMNSGKYDSNDYLTVKKYWEARKTVLDIARQLCSDLFDINYKLIDQRASEAHRILSYILKTNKTSTNESIEFSTQEYIQMASLIECNDIEPNSFNFMDGGIIDKNANVQDFVSEEIPTSVILKIDEMKLYPMQKIINGNILMKSDIDNTVWVYNVSDKSLVCQNTLNSVYNN